MLGDALIHLLFLHFNFSNLFFYFIIKEININDIVYFFFFLMIKKVKKIF